MCFGGSQAQPVTPAPAPPQPSPLAVNQDPTQTAQNNDLNSYGTANGGTPNLSRPDDTPVASASVPAGGTGLAM